MTTREEISIRMGIDSRGVQSGLASVRGAVDRFGAQIGRQFKQIGAGLASALGFQKLVQQLRQLTDEIGKLNPELDIEGRRQQSKKETFGALSASDKEDIVQAELSLEKAKDTASMFVGKILAAAGKVGTGLGGLFGGKGFGEAITDAEVEAHTIQMKREVTGKAIADTKAKEAAEAKRLADESKRTQDIIERYGQASKEHLSVLKEQASVRERMNKESDRGRKLVDDLKDAKGDMSRLSLGEAQSAADAAFGEFNPGNLQYSNKQLNDIRTVQQLEFQAKQETLWGNKGKANDLTEKRLKMLQDMPWLKEGDRNPLKGIYESMEEQRKSMFELLDKAKSVGLKVNIVDVKV